MADKLVQSISVNVGAVGTTNLPLFRVPSGHGGITIQKAYLLTGAAATITAQLNNNGTALGTAITATIGTLANATTVAGVQKELTVSTAYQAEGTWVALAAPSGAGGTVTLVTVEYIFGK